MSLGGCTTGRTEDLVWIGVSDDPCLVEADGRRFALPVQEVPLKAHLQALADRSAGALMGAAPGTSLICYAAASLATQNVGFDRVGLLSLPEPVTEP